MFRSLSIVGFAFLLMLSACGKDEVKAVPQAAPAPVAPAPTPTPTPQPRYPYQQNQNQNCGYGYNSGSQCGTYDPTYNGCPSGYSCYYN